MPLSIIAIFILAPQDLRQNCDARVSDVVIEIPGFLQLERGRVVNLDLKPSAVYVEFLPIARHAETEARPARYFGFLRQPIVGQIELPELAALISVGSIGNDRVCGLLVRRHLQTRHAGRRWADRIVVYMPRGQVQTRQAEYTVVNNWIG